MREMLESSFMGQVWRVIMCDVIDIRESWTGDTVFGYVELHNLDDTQRIHSRWIKLISNSTYGEDSDDEWGEIKLVDEISLMTRNEGEDWAETVLIDGDGEYVDSEDESFRIIQRTKWRHMVTNMYADPHERLIKFDFNLAVDGDADIAHYIENIPDFASWVRKYALAEMYP